MSNRLMSVQLGLPDKNQLQNISGIEVLVTSIVVFVHQPMTVLIQELVPLILTSIL